MELKEISLESIHAKYSEELAERIKWSMDWADEREIPYRFGVIEEGKFTVKIAFVCEDFVRVFEYRFSTKFFESSLFGHSDCVNAIKLMEPFIQQRDAQFKTK